MLWDIRKQVRHLFFFRAVGGIRDGHVTGVQTCALPILVVINSIDQRIFLILILIAASGAVNACLTVTLAASVRQIRKEADLTRVNGLTSLIENLPVFRSEERRVGKDCVAGWWR